MASYSTAIRDLAVGGKGPTLAASEFERTVHIWDIESGLKTAQFDTIMDFGGRRLALSQDGTLCAAGAYHVHGIAVYDTRDGRRLWQRKDLKKVQALKFSQNGSQLFAFFEVGPAHVLDVRTGVTIEKLRGVSYLVESPFGEAEFVNHNGRPEVLNRGQSTRFGAEYYLDRLFVNACFTEDSLVFGKASFLRGSRLDPSVLVMRTFCYSLDGGKMLWEHSVRPGLNVLDRGYDPGRRAVLLVTWPAEGGEHRLVQLDKDTGIVRAEYPLRGALARTVFAKQGTLLVSSRGDVVATSDGRAQRVLPFPQESRSGTLVVAEE